MKTQNVISASILAALIILGIVAVCLASPWLVSDPQATVTSYTISGDTELNGTVTAQADGSLRKDLAGISAKSHTISVTCSNSWGTSTATPFTFTSGVPSAPGNIHIIAQ
jgi:hypothetical protein